MSSSARRASGGRAGPVVIVGGGLAGATAAAALREHGFDGEVHLVAAEGQPPYNRPPLSKAYLRGEARFADQLVHPLPYYSEHDIRLSLGQSAVAIDAARRVVELDSGATLTYGRLLIATGGRTRAPWVPGARLEGVLGLRTLHDADRIRAAARPGSRAVVVGLGFIGSEVTASLRQLGVEVTAIDPNQTPLARALGAEVGRVLAGIHRDKGVELLLGESIGAFEGGERVERVRTLSGRTVPCDFVVTGVGIVPNVELAARAGAAADGGLLVDELGRTSLPDVFAAGDVANHQHPIFGRVRVEHWNNASRQGRAVALSMLDQGAPYDYVHSFWSDQYEHTIEYVGHAARWDRLVVRGGLESRKFLGFYLKDGLVRAAVGLDRGGDPEDPASDGELKWVPDLIRHRVLVDLEQLADEDVPLADLVPIRARS